MWIDRIEVDGAELPLDEVLADAVIRHGRAGIDDPPTASTCQIRLQHVTAAISGNFRVGVPLVVEADGAPRFTGSVTDASLDDDVLTIIGAGPLSTLHRYEIGAAPWPAEAWHLRVERAFAEAGLSDLLLLLYDADYDPELLERGTVLEPEDPTDLYSYLGQLAVDVGAAIADTPDGRVLVQELAARLKLSTLTWVAVPTSLSWAEVDPGCSWEEAVSLPALDPDTPTTGPVTIDPADVLYVPVWEMVDEVENVSTVEYGVDLAVTDTDETSVTLYGERPGGVSTQIAAAGDALKRAEDRVGRRAFPRWVIRSVPLLRAYTVAVGQIARLSGFPPPSPHEDWSPVIEGWTDTIEGDLWLQELAVTDPLLSGVALLWLQVPADISWAEVDPATNWTEATTLASLT